MNNHLGCPPADVLVDLIQGKMVEPDLSELALHLEECSDCQNKARTLSPHDTLVQSLRGHAPLEDKIAQSAPLPLIEKLKQIPRRHASAWSEHGSTQGHPVSSEEQQLDFLAPPAAADEIGRLGHYRILKILGRGGMGMVFLADDPKLERQVALKVMLPNLAANPRARERFLREARAAAKLKSDHIVTIYEVDEANGVPYLAMERLEGQSLEAVLRAKLPLGARQIIQIARDIAQGLAVAHEKGVVHRDIKPGNVWLEARNEGRMATDETEATIDTSLAAPSAFLAPRVKILDFGLAHAEKDGVHITQPGAFVGTPAYMAPEQARGETSIDARADLFALGCVLYHLCAGDLPFKAETMMGTLLAITVNDPVPLSKLNTRIPLQLSDLAMQLLEKDPARRPQTARDVISRLTAIERSSPLAGRASDGQPGSDNANLKHTPTTQRIAPDSAPSRRKRGPLTLVLVGLLGVALAIAGTIFFWQTPDGRVVRIECLDPAIKIAFDDGELKVTGAYKEPLTLKPGKVGLQIVKGDFKFETDKLIVNKGDAIVLKIEVTEGKVQIVQAGKGVLDSKLLPPPNKNAAWESAVARMEAFDQVAAVTAKLKERNALFDEKSLQPVIENGVVVGLNVGDASALHDLSPLRALAGLKDIHLHGKFVGAADLSPLRGMKLDSIQTNGCPHRDFSPLRGMPLWRANFWGATTGDLSPLRDMKLIEANFGHGPTKDISVLKGMPLERLCLNISHVEDLSPLAGAPLKRLEIANTKVRDLTPVAKAPIEYLSLDGSPIQDYSFLRNMPLTELWLDYDPVLHEKLLRALPTLRMINFRPAAETLNAPTETLDVDRRAARWALSLGGIVRVNGEERFIGNSGELPSGKFTLTTINLFGKSPTDAGLANLKGLTGLKQLVLYSTKVGDPGLAHIKDLTSLTILDLGRTKVTDAGLDGIKNLKGLTTLSLHYTAVSEAWLENLKDFKNLVELNINGAVTDAGLARIAKVRTLKDLSLQLAPVTDTGLAALKGLPGLTRLDARNTKVTAKGLADFHAAVPGCKIEHDRGVIDAINSDRRAAEWVLSLGGSVRVNGGSDDIKAAAALPKDAFTLTWINLQGIKTVTDDGLANLKALSGLTYLQLSDTAVTDAGLPSLKNLRGLKDLFLSGTNVSDVGLAHLRGLPKLAQLYLAITKVTDSGLAQLKEFPELTHIDLYGTGIGDAGLPYLKDCERLSIVVLGATRVTDEGLVHLKGLRNLTQLGLLYTGVSDVGLEQLKDCTALTLLNLAGTKVTDAGLPHLKNMKALQKLFLIDDGVTDAGLAHLHNLKKLTDVDLRMTAVTMPALNELHAAVPGCSIRHDGGVIEAKR